MFLARDLWHSTSGQSSCSLSPCFAKFLFRKFIFLRVQICICFGVIISVYSVKYLDPHSLKRTPF